MNLNKIYSEGLKIKFNLFKKFCEIEQGHPGSILSIFDVVNFLYLGKFVKLSKNKEKNDYLIISKGHAASVQYPYLIRNGIVKKNESFRFLKEVQNLTRLKSGHLFKLNIELNKKFIKVNKKKGIFY